MIRIFNIALIDAAPRADGSRAVATFDAVTGGIRLAGCVVVLMPDQTIVAEPAAAKTRSGRERVVRIIDPAVEREFQAAALAAFHALSNGGHHAV